MKNESKYIRISLLILLVTVLGYFLNEEIFHSLLLEYSFKERKEEVSLIKGMNSQKNDNAQIWVNSDFKHFCGNKPCLYSVDISYPKNYTFHCCGELDMYTIHSIYLKQSDVKTNNLIEVRETSLSPDQSNQKNLVRGDLIAIDNITTKNIGTSFEAISVKNSDYIYAGHNSYESYSFKIKKQDGKLEYLSVIFFTPTDFTSEFKLEFLNRLKVWE